MSKELLTFAFTIAISMVLIVILGKRRKGNSRYERAPHNPSDWQKLDRGIDPSE